MKDPASNLETWRIPCEIASENCPNAHTDGLRRLICNQNNKNFTILATPPLFKKSEPMYAHSLDGAAWTIECDLQGIYNAALVYTSIRAILPVW
jgi:hypothetical protein